MPSTPRAGRRPSLSSTFRRADGARSGRRQSSGGVVRFYPEVRTAHLERAAETRAATTFYLRKRADYHPELEDPSRPFIRSSAFMLPLRVRRLQPEVLEVPEPLWLRYAPHAAYMKAALWLLTPPRHRPQLVFYAIENATLDRVPNRLRRLPLFAWRCLVRSLATAGALGTARAVFGTEGARAAYAEALPRSVMNRLEQRSRVIPALPCRCGCASDELRDVNGVLFVSSFEPRKGVDLVLKAWPAVKEACPLARLTLLGHGPLELAVARLAELDESVVFVGKAPRNSVHRAYRAASVVVLPSQPSGRWREQVGLPIVEALAHGYRVVATTEMGLSSALAAMGYPPVEVPSSSSDVAVAIAEALSRAAGESAALQLPDVDGRLEAEYWLVGAANEVGQDGA